MEHSIARPSTLHYQTTLTFEMRERVKKDAKHCYQLLKSIQPSLSYKLTEQYDLYAQFFGADNFSQSCVHAQHTIKGDYITPFTLPVITIRVEEKLSALLGDVTLGKQAYRLLAEQLGTVSRQETSTCNVLGTDVTVHDESRYTLHYTPNNLPHERISVFLTHEDMSMLYPRLCQMSKNNQKERNPEKNAINWPRVRREPGDHKTPIDVNLPRYRTPKNRTINAFGKASRGCQYYHRAALFSYGLNNQTAPGLSTETLYMDCYLDDQQLDALIRQCAAVLPQS
jgi:hypothetical protein